MKRILVPLLVLMLLCMSLGVLAEGEKTITLELNTAKLPLYTADDPYLDGLTEKTDELPVLVLPVKKSWQLQVKVSPSTVKNKQVVFSVDNEEVVRVRGNSLTGLKAGSTVLTIASKEDPDVTVQYRIAVIQQVTRITVTAAGKNVGVGEKVALSPAFVPEDATRKEVTWTSADERIATVDENGVVTGVKRGAARITATATDGSKVRATISVQVVQKAEEITLNKPEVTVDAGRTAMLKATVLPKDTNDKNVVWSSSDDSVARVNAMGQVTGVALGECEIICTSKVAGEVQARAKVHVQQPVKKITFDPAPVVYAGETAVISWKVEPADASNPAVTLSTGNKKLLAVSNDEGNFQATITGLQAGDTYVNAITTDGSNRQARLKVKVLQHVTGVHMRRRVAYVDLGMTSTTGAILEPDKASNHNMTWTSANPSVAAVEPEPKNSSRVKIKGVAMGETTVTGITEDGGFPASIRVKVGEWENSLKWVSAYWNGKGWLQFEVKNVSDLNITSITIEMECYDGDGKPQSVNTKDGSNVVKGVYNKPLAPGKTTYADQWKMQNYNKDIGLGGIIVRITEFQIDNDWVKTVRKNNKKMRTRYDPYHILP